MAKRLERKRKLRQGWKGARTIMRLGPGGVYRELDHASFVYSAAGDDMKRHGAELLGCVHELSRQAERPPPHFAEEACEDLIRTGKAVDRNADRLSLYLRDR